MFTLVFTEKIQLYWFDDVQYVNGYPVKGIENQAEIIADVQPLNMREVEQLGEGQRGKETLKIYTQYQPIQLLEAEKPDLLSGAEFGYKGKRYIITSSEKRLHIFNYMKFTVIEKVV